MDTIRRILFLALLSLAYSALAQDTTGFNPSTHVATGGDLDGDGRIDLVLLPLSEPDIPFIHFSADETGNRRENLLLADVLPGASWISGATQLAVGDVDASGVDDLVLLSNDTLYVLTFKVRNNGNLKVRVKQEQPWADLELDGSPNDYQIVLHDMDGDGHADLVLDPVIAVRDLQTVLAKENGKFKKSNRYEIRLRMDEGDTIHYGDFNGDLATDVLLQRPTRNKLKIFLSGEGIHDGVNLPDRALGFEVDAATAVIGVAQWTGDGLADLIVQQRVDPADPSDDYDIQHRALKNRGRTTNNGAPKFSECALPGIGYGPNRGGLPECYAVEGATTAKTSAKGVPAQCTSCDSGFDLTATPNPCEDGFGGAKACASQVDVIGPRSTSYCLFADAISLLCSTHQASVLLNDVPAGGVTLSIRSDNDISSKQLGSLHVVHPSDLPEPPLDIDFTNADFDNFTPPRTGQPSVELCWSDYNDISATQSVWRAQGATWESVDLSGMTSTPLTRSDGFRRCVTDDPRSGAHGDGGFTTHYRIEICDGGYCVENGAPYPEIHFYPLNQAIQNVTVDVTHPGFSPPMDVDGTFTLSWTDPAYLQAGDYVEYGLDDVWTTATGQSQQFAVAPVDERQSVQVGVRVMTTSGEIAGSEVSQTVEIQEGAVPGAIGSIVLSGMSESSNLLDDDGNFSVSWSVPTGTVDSYRWRLQEVAPDGSTTNLESSNFETSTILDFSGYQIAQDRNLRFRVLAENLAGMSDWEIVDFVVQRPLVLAEAPGKPAMQVVNTVLQVAQVSWDLSQTGNPATRVDLVLEHTDVDTSGITSWTISDVASPFEFSTNTYPAGEYRTTALACTADGCVASDISDPLVLAAPNYPPEFDPNANLEKWFSRTDDQLDQQILAIDPESQSLTYSVQFAGFGTGELPPGVSFDSATGTFSGSFQNVDAVVYNVEVIVSDGVSQIEAPVVWEVVPALGSGLKPVRNLGLAGDLGPSRTFQLTWEYSAEDFGFVTGRPQEFVVENTLESGTPEGEIERITVGAYQSSWTTATINDIDHLGATYQVKACRQGGSGQICGVAATFSLPSPDPASVDLPTPTVNLSSGVASKSGEVNTKLSLTISNADSPRTDYYRIQETGPLGTKIYFSTEPTNDLQRGMPGDYTVSVQACDRDRAAGDECGPAATSQMASVQPWEAVVAPGSISAFYVPDGNVRLSWTYPQAESRSLASRPDYYMVVANSNTVDETWEVPVHNIVYSSLILPPHKVFSRWFEVRGCKWTGVCGPVTRTYIPSFATLPVETPSQNTPTPGVPGGPDDLRPGEWYDPDRAGTGWTFFWANNLRYVRPDGQTSAKVAVGDETHNAYGDTYDLLAYWFAYRKHEGSNGDITWQPTWYFASMLFDEDCVGTITAPGENPPPLDGNGCYTGTLYAPQNPSQLPQNGEGYPLQPIVGSVDLFLGLSSRQAFVRVQITDTDFAADSELGGHFSSSLEYFGNTTVGSSFFGTSEKDHLSGIYWDNEDKLTPFSVVNWNEGPHESLIVAHYDSRGRATWARGDAEYCPRLDDGTFHHTCDPSETWREYKNFNLHQLTKGFNPVETTPCELYGLSEDVDNPGQCEQACTINEDDEEICSDPGVLAIPNEFYPVVGTATRRYSFIPDRQMRIDVDLPGLQRTDHLIHKQANFHDIRFFIDGDQGPDGCALGNDEQDSCEVSLQWFSDGYYPDVTASRCAYSEDPNDPSNSIVSDCVDIDPPAGVATWPNAVDVYYTFREEGQYVFRLRRSDDPEAPVMAQSKPLTISLSKLPEARAAVAQTPYTQLARPEHVDRLGLISGSGGASGGAATYSVPVVVAPGRQSMQPSLSLNYSSRGGNGLMGMGWSLSGQSSIHRCARTVAQDGQNGSVVFDRTKDRLCLDGQRLVVVEGQYGEVNSRYLTEIDSSARITLLGGHMDSDQSWFTVDRADNSIAVYGNGPAVVDATFVPPLADGTSGSVPLHWSIAHERDRAGNAVVYRYDMSIPTEQLLDDIQYTAKVNSLGEVVPSSSARSVDFVYGPRPNYVANLTDSSVSFLGGRKTTQSRLLNNIYSYAAQNAQDPVRQITLVYAPAYTTGRNLLESIVDCGTSELDCLSNRFEYNNNPVTHAPWVVNGAAVEGGSGDVGEPELLSPTVNAQTAINCEFDPASEPTCLDPEAALATSLETVGDFDGDGVKEVVATVREATGYSRYLLFLDVSPDSGTSPSVRKRILLPQVIGGQFNEILSQVPRYHDINADGRVDFVGEMNGSLAFATYVGDIPGFSGNCAVTMDSICQFRRIDTNIPFDTETWEPIAGNGANYPSFTLADFNNDAYLDVVTRAQSGSSWVLKVYLGRSGQGDLTTLDTLNFDLTGQPIVLESFQLQLPYDLVATMQERVLSVNDWDSDGDSEILLGAPYPGSSFSVGPARLVELSGFNGSSFVADVYRLKAGENGLAALGIERPLFESHYQFADLNGDGLQDYLFVPAELNNGAQVFYPNGNPAPPSGPCTSNPCPRSWHVQLNTGSRLEDGTHPTFAPPVDLQIYQGLQEYSLSNGASNGLVAETWRPRMGSALQWTDYDNDGKAEYLFPARLIAKGGYFLRTDPNDLEGTPGIFRAPEPDAVIQPQPEVLSRNLYHYPVLSRFDPSGYEYEVLDVAWEQGIGFQVDDPVATGIFGSARLASIGDLFSDGTADFISATGCKTVWNACDLTTVVLEPGVPTFSKERSLWISEGRVGEFTAIARVPQETLAKAQDSIGNVFSWSYQPLSVRDDNDVVAAGGLPFYQVPDPGERYINDHEFYFTSSMFAVQSFRRQERHFDVPSFVEFIPGGPWTETRFAYGEAVFNKEGRGFQGFRSVYTESLDSETVNDKHLNTFTASFFHQRFPIAGRIEQSYSQRADFTITGEIDYPPGTLLSRDEFGYKCVTQTDAVVSCDSAAASGPGGVYRPFQSSATQRMFDLTMNGNGQLQPSTFRYSLTSQNRTVDRFGNATFQQSVRSDYDQGAAQPVLAHSTTTRSRFETPADFSTDWWPRKRLWSSTETSMDYEEEPDYLGLPGFESVESIVQTIDRYSYREDLRSIECMKNIAVDVASKLTESEIDSLTGDVCVVDSDTDARFEQVRTTESIYDCAPGSTTGCYGNVVKAINRGSAADVPESSVLEPNREVRFVYSADGYFVESTTSEAGAVDLTELSYVDPRFGAPYLTRNSAGLWQRSEFDSFGRAIDTIFPKAASRAEAEQVAVTDTTSQYAPRQSMRYLRICSSAPVAKAAYCMHSMADGAPEQWTFHDSSGRVLRTVTQAFEVGQLNVSDTTYNARGEKVSQSQAYEYTSSSSVPAAISIYDYDHLGRMVFKEDIRPELDIDLTDAPPAAPDRSLFTHYRHNGLKTTVLVTGIPNDTHATFNNGEISEVFGRPVPIWFYVERRYASNGWLLDTHDAMGERTRYWQDGRGNAKVIMDPDGNLTAANYDAFGNRTALWDPNMMAPGGGIDKEFRYNGLGEIGYQVDGRGTEVAHLYDGLGRRVRTVSRTANNQFMVDEWTFQANTGLLDTEARFTGDGNYPLAPGQTAASRGLLKRNEKQTTYDPDSMRPEGRTHSILVEDEMEPRVYSTFVETHDYLGRPLYTDYPTIDNEPSPRIAHVYSYEGYPVGDIESADVGTQNYLRRIVAMTPTGQVERQVLGNGMEEEYIYHPQTYEMKEIKIFRNGVDPSSGAPFRNQWTHIEYGYDFFGNLSAQRTGIVPRGDYYVETQELFAYDVLHRMIESERIIQTANFPQRRAVTIEYDKLGNILSKSDTSSGLQYGLNSTAGPNAVSGGAVQKAAGWNNVVYEYDANGNRTFEREASTSNTMQAVQYDAFDKATRIEGASTESTFAHGADQQRYWQGGIDPTIYVDKLFEAKGAGLSQRKFYLGNYAVWTVEGGIGRLRYLHRDRLGSVIAASTSNGPVVPNSIRGFDAFGKPRDDDWDDSADGLNRTDITTRGFTDHEHLNDVELIHMNGRVFDYNLGRFLSIDPFIQFPENSQSLNPYSYILNNPMSGTDPTGYIASICSRPSSTGSNCSSGLSERTINQLLSGQRSGIGQQNNDNGARTFIPFSFNSNDEEQSPEEIGSEEEEPVHLGSMTTTMPLPIGIGLPPAPPINPSTSLPQVTIPLWIRRLRPPNPIVFLFAPGNLWQETGPCTNGHICDPVPFPAHEDVGPPFYNSEQLRDELGRFASDPDNPPSPYTFSDAQRRAAWKRLANDPSSPLTEAQRQEIRDRGWRGPQRINEFGELETMELSHEPIPLREGGTDVVPRWPADHAAVDPHRKLKNRD